MQVTLRQIILNISLLIPVIASGQEADEKPKWYKEWDFSGYVETELRLFPDSPSDPRQTEDANLSFALEPEFYREWNNGDLALTIEPFVRYDLGDEDRTHVDLREFVLRRTFDTWSLKFGVSKVFWGVTESLHLVDTINQIDQVENVDMEDRLGQPMLNATWLSDFGTFDFFLLPYFRERTFPGIGGRLRSLPYVDTDTAAYESSLKQWHPDGAIRWAHMFGDVDIALHYFRGTSRDPVFRPFIDASGQAALQPIYNQMHQGGMELQWTRDGWLLKFEGLHRDGRAQHFQAFSTGFEYTFYGIAGSSIDAGLIGEYLYNSKGNNAPTPFNNDVFVGTRLTLNDEQDTSLIAGGIFDHENGSASARIEFERRIGSNYTLAIEGQKIIETDPTDPLHAFRNDSFIQVAFRRYF